MEQRTFGWTGVKVPVIGQGTWQMEDDDRSRCIETLRRGLDAGMTHIDTAEMYGDGHVEASIVSAAIAGRRDEVFRTSKVLPDHATFDGTIAACERSLRRLGTDHLDLYLLHWPGEHPLAQTLAAFQRLVDDGKIRFFGVSNFDAEELAEAVELAGPRGIVCDQVLHHLEERAVERVVVPACERHRLAAVAYSPLGHGQLPSTRSGPGRVLAEIAASRGVRPHAVALAFLVRRPGTFAIPKTSSPEHALENAAAGELRLSAGELARIDAAFPADSTPRPLPML